jgi:hypothetical protein
MVEEQNLLLQEEKEFKRFYKFSLWWVEHQAFLRRLAYGLFVMADAILFLFVLWTMFDSFAVSFGDDEMEVAKIVAYGQSDLHGYTTANRADPIVPEQVLVFGIGDNRYDFFAELSNPNSDWWVEFTYAFAFDAGSTASTEGFLLPGQTKPVISLATTSQTFVRNAQLELTNVRWHRINHHEIYDYSIWQEDRMRLVITDATFTKETGFEKDVFGRTTFTVYNNTAYSYFDPQFLVLLKRGSAVVGVSRATVASLGVGERREISLNWFGILPSATSVEVIPDIHLFDPDVYQRLKGEPGIDTRAIEE